MLSTDTPSKLTILLQILRESCDDTLTVATMPSLPSTELLHRLAARIIRSILLVTANVRLEMLKDREMVVFLLNQSQRSYSVENVDVAEIYLRCILDLFLVASPETIHAYVMDASGVLVRPILSLIQTCSHATTFDVLVRLISYLMQLGTEESQLYLCDGSTIFDLLPTCLSRASIRLILVQNLATHLATKLPERLYPVYIQLLNNLRQFQDHHIQNYAIRCLHVLSSVGVKVGVKVLFAESVESRRLKQIWMHRQCEGCARMELRFGEFMTCAGCRKVRYCSKVPVVLFSFFGFVFPI